jgi:hypothetical protein
VWPTAAQQGPAGSQTLPRVRQFTVLPRTQGELHEATAAGEQAADIAGGADEVEEDDADLNEEPVEAEVLAKRILPQPRQVHLTTV